MAAGYSYDSDEGRAICASLSAIMTGTAYATSAEMASELGTFPRYDENSDDMLRVMRNHRLAAHGKDEGYEGLTIKPVPLKAGDCPDSACRKPRQQHGTRRLSWAKSMATAMLSQQ